MEDAVVDGSSEASHGNTNGYMDSDEDEKFAGTIRIADADDDVLGACAGKDMLIDEDT